MLDIKSKIVLKILSKECPNGSYKIVDSSDIISAMPNKYKVDSEGLGHILNYLERQDCISIKYDDENIFCIAILPYGYEICENSNQKEASKNKRLPLTIIFIIFFIICFTASFIANLLSKLITLP